MGIHIGINILSTDIDIISFKTHLYLIVLGEPFYSEDAATHRMDYFGPVVMAAARISAYSRGGQV